MEFNRACIILLLTVAPPLLYFCCANQGLWWDEAVYLGLAKNILEGKGYYINLHQDSFRPPLFPYLTAAVWFVTGVTESVRVLPPVFAIMAALSAFFLGKRLYSAEVGFWTGMLLGTSPLFIFYSERFLTESLFVLLTTLSVHAFYKGVKGGWHLPLAGFIAGLAFLTRYAGALLMVVYAIYPFCVLLKERSFKRSLFRRGSYWLGVMFFVLLLLPWMHISQVYYGSPLGALGPQSKAVSGEYYGGPWYFYFQHWIEIFGIAGLFIIPGVLFALCRKKDSDILLLLILAITLGFFMFVTRKELRYLIHFFSFYYLAAGLGIYKMRTLTKKRMLSCIMSAIAIVLIFVNLYSGVQAVNRGLYSASALREAGLWLRNSMPRGTSIMSNNVPPLYYYTGRPVYYFPEDRSRLTPNITAHKVSHIVLEYWEPTYPEYVWTSLNGERKPSNIFEGFTLERTFDEYGRTVVWVYRV